LADKRLSREKLDEQLALQGDSVGIDFGGYVASRQSGLTEKQILTNLPAKDAQKRETAQSVGYLEPAAEAAGKKQPHWSPDRGDLNIIDPSSWSKLQMYAGDVGRAHGWSKEHAGTFPQTNALRHALSTAYIAYRYTAAAGIGSGQYHELETGFKEVLAGVPWKNDLESKKTWADHSIDINNNLAGAKIAQSIFDKGGSWKDVENAVVEAVRHAGNSGKLKQPDVTLHSFLGQP
jgi:hypothetical protein